MPNREQFVAFSLSNSEHSLNKINYKGEVISTIEINNVDIFSRRHNRARKIDVNSENVFIATKNVLNIYDIDTFSLSNKSVKFNEQIFAVNSLERNDFFVILKNGTILLIENEAITEITKIEKEIVALGFDKINFIFYFGNSKGEIFAVDKNGNYLVEDSVG